MVVKDRRKLPFAVGTQVLACSLATATVLLTGCPAPKFQAPAPSPTPATPTPAPPPPPTPTPASALEPRPTPIPETFVPRRSYDTSKLFNGLKIYSHLETFPGGIAPEERTVDESFSVDISMKVKVPAAMTTLDQFSGVNPSLPASFPALGELLKTAKVSNYYHGLYALKVKSLQQDLRTLDQILSRHNFFDCGTILELAGGATKRKALLLQADMDVVADGSDSDRLLEVDGTSMFYQPFTSYRWKKRTDIPSQFLPEKQARLQEAQNELSTPGLIPARQQALRDSISAMKLQISDLTTYSFLISKADPFIVLPGFLLRDRALPYRPAVGDYAVVFFHDKIYPAIFGDVGPSVKVGEASLRLATLVNTSATAYRRPSNNLDVTYLVFPGSADEPFGPPDYGKWRTRCIELLTELGNGTGPGVEVAHFEDILKPAPTPSPASLPSPTATNAPPLPSSEMAIPTPKPLPPE
ncbi:MAG TPA: glycoside hydrolase family 75 protein [Chthoniobacterales bacterium]